MFTKTLTVLLSAALAVQAAPHVKRQAVTSLISSGSAPAGCTIMSTSAFGIGIHKATDVPKATMFKRQVSQSADGQPVAPTGAVSIISDGQPQAPTSTMKMMPISQIGDGQVQAHYSVPAITQIGDGQVQAPTATGVNQITDGQVQAPTGTAASQVTDGQVVAPTGSAASQSTDGQVVAPTGTGATQKTDGQPVATSTATPNVQMVACKTNSTLSLTIENGVLYDGLRRQGYIADNYQFQFDAGAPQAGAIITAGFSLCSNGTLALGGSTIFWQCLSGTFYNLYDRDWAFQCEPVYLTALDLIDCPA